MMAAVTSIGIKELHGVVNQADRGRVVACYTQSSKQIPYTPMNPKSPSMFLSAVRFES
jgi:hypothetical protein